MLTFIPKHSPFQLQSVILFALHGKTQNWPPLSPAFLDLKAAFQLPGFFSRPDALFLQPFLRSFHPPHTALLLPCGSHLQPHPNTPPVLCTNIPFQALSSALDGPRILPAAPIPSPGDTHHPRSLIQRAHPPGKPGCLGMNEGRPSPSLFVDPSRSSIYQQSFLVSPRRL